MQDKYEYIKQIGHGAYGVVCSAIDHSIKAKVAIKKVPKAFEDLIDAKRIVREIKLLSKYISFIIFSVSFILHLFIFSRILRSWEHYRLSRCVETTIANRIWRHLYYYWSNGNGYAQSHLLASRSHRRPLLIFYVPVAQRLPLHSFIKHYSSWFKTK